MKNKLGKLLVRLGAKLLGRGQIVLKDGSILIPGNSGEVKITVFGEGGGGGSGRGVSDLALGSSGGGPNTKS